MGGAYYGKLGFLNIMFGAGQGCGIETGVATAGGWGMGPKTHSNIALMRAIQFGPKFYMFIVGEDNEGPINPGEVNHVIFYDFKADLLPLLDEFSRKSTDEQKNIANLVIDTPKDNEADISGYFIDGILSSSDAITNSILAAGFDLVVTSDPIEGADMYYVFTPGVIYGEGEDLPLALAALADGEAPVFYQVIGEIPDMPNWNKVASALGIRGKTTPIVNDDDSSYFEPIPETVLYSFQKGEYSLKYAGYSFELWDDKQIGKYSVGHYLNYINPADLSSEVLIEGSTAMDGDGLFDDRTALIIRKDNLYYVNGGFIHLDSSHILANIMGELNGVGSVYNSPSYGYFTNGKSRSVFFAPYDIEVDLNVMGGTRVTEFNEEGERLPNSRLILEDGRLVGQIGRFHLVVID